MKKVTIYFSDTHSLTDYLIKAQPKSVEVDSNHKSIQGWLSDDEIVKAELQYNGFSVPVQKRKLN